MGAHSILAAARAICKQASYRLMVGESHDELGPTLVGETWELSL